MTDSKRFFPKDEFQERRRRVRALMSAEGLDALLISTPENIYYLCGLDHMGFFAYQMLILPLRGTPILVTRAMERATVGDQVPDLIHYGYPDGTSPPPPEPDAKKAADEQAPDTVSLTTDIEGSVFVEPAIRKGAAQQRGYLAPVKETCRALADAGLGSAHMALEEGGSFLTYRIADGIKRGMLDAHWHDGTGLVDRCRIILSPLEIQCTRRAAVISDAMMQAAIAASGVDISECDVMAAIYDTMFRRGGTYPGFVPLVRSTASLTHEHGTWSDSRLTASDLLFLELSGCARRYHAPMGRLVFMEKPPANAYKAQEVCLEAHRTAAEAIRPGVASGDVYAAWHSVLDRHGLANYTRHHCGYSTGIAYPPSWSGGGVPVGLRAGSDMQLETGMVFHLMSWLLRSEHGDSFLSDTLIVTDDGCEMLTTTPREVIVRA